MLVIEMENYNKVMGYYVRKHISIKQLSNIFATRTPTGPALVKLKSCSRLGS